MIACRTTGCDQVGEPAGWLELGLYRRPVGGPCPACQGPTEGPDNSTLIVPPPHQVADGPDHQASAYSATAALLELTTRLDPAFMIRLEVEPVEHEISVTIHDCEPADASALAERLGLTEHNHADTETRRHHHWRGSWRGFPARVVWLETLPAVTG